MMPKEVQERNAPKKRPSLALRRLEIHNFKAIDHVELEFPAPRFEDEPDIWVLGSKNGLGKTSILQYR